MTTKDLCDECNINKATMTIDCLFTRQESRVCDTCHNKTISPPKNTAKDKQVRKMAM